MGSLIRIKQSLKKNEGISRQRRILSKFLIPWWIPKMFLCRVLQTYGFPISEDSTQNPLEGPQPKHS